jgi:predicted metalloprotease with PDZ domain
MKKSFLYIFLVCVSLLFLTFNLKSQDIEAKIKIVSIKPAIVQVDGKFLNKNLASFNWSFLRDYADVSGIGSRFSKLNLIDEKGNKISSQELIPGEFQSNQIAEKFSYEVKLDVISDITSMAHVSWLGEKQGLLMLNDIFPQWQVKENQQLRAKLKLEIPRDWRIIVNENKISDDEFDVADISKSVFFVGRDFREKSVWFGKSQMNFLISGEWKFSDEEALQIVSSILQEHRKVFGELAFPKAQIFVLPFLKETNPDRWRAETRGANLTIVSGSSQYKSVAKQRLSEQLRHEIFHLWIPNGLALNGNYDWFFEGFTIYQALRAGVKLQQIRFQDYLNTLSRAFDNTQAASKKFKMSLLDASNKRWDGTTSLIYNKGIIVAFLCDLELLEKNGDSIEDVLKKIYKKHKIPNEFQDGNMAILKILKDYDELRPIIENYVESTTQIDLTQELTPFGIEVKNVGNETKLQINENLSSKQKDLLKKLGYNQ